MPTTDETTVTFKTDSFESGPIPLRDLAGAADRAERGELFDSTEYQTPLPTLHGHRPDTLKLTFAGGIEIPLTDGQLVDYLKTLHLGEDVDLHVTATVAKVNWAYRVNQDDEETVTHVVGVAVHSIDLEPEYIYPPVTERTTD